MNKYFKHSVEYNHGLMMLICIEINTKICMVAMGDRMLHRRMMQDNLVIASDECVL